MDPPWSDPAGLFWCSSQGKASASLPCCWPYRGTGWPLCETGGWTRWTLPGLTQQGSSEVLIRGRPRPLCPVVGPPEELVGPCVRREAGLDGPSLV